jgi:predicted protein tyrosine phosphatase
MTLTLSEEIRNCKAGVYANPYQGKDKKVVFVCSMGILRSATGARLYAHKYNTRSAGTYPDALVPLSRPLVQWADELVFVNEHNYKMALQQYPIDGTDVPFNMLIKDKAKVLNIPDTYEHMHPKLKEAFETQYEPFN